jgi:MraZ protein
MLFSGSTLRSLDSKGRLMRPPDFREALAAFDSENEIVLTRFYQRVRAYPVPIWQEVHEKLMEQEHPSDLLLNFSLMLTGYAKKVPIDSQGRINIPQTHIRFADLTRENMVIGYGKRFEIWNEERFEQVMKQTGDFSGEVSKELATRNLSL